MNLFDFFYDAHRATPRARLLALIETAQEDLATMSDKDLRELLAERYAMQVIAQGVQFKKRRGRIVGKSSKTESP